MRKSGQVHFYVTEPTLRRRVDYSEPLVTDPLGGSEGCRSPATADHRSGAFPLARRLHGAQRVRAMGERHAPIARHKLVQRPYRIRVAWNQSLKALGIVSQ